jgi:hypothetical protein
MKPKLRRASRPPKEHARRRMPKAPGRFELLITTSSFTPP